MSDLFANAPAGGPSYTAQDIEVLEGLEPVRRRPGMYIGGTDERALHHLVAELVDNAMDEAVAGHANRIELELHDDNSVSVRDNGRGIPTDPHPRFPDKSALEVILTTLHSGGKFSGKAYATSGGLHGVGLSVVNALSSALTIEVARDRRLWRQDYARGQAQAPLSDQGAVQNRRGTTIRFTPDPEIFGAGAVFKPDRLYRMARSKAYLFRGVEVRWKCPAASGDTPAEATLHFPNGLGDFLTHTLADRPVLTPAFQGETPLPDDLGRVEWAVAWTETEGFVHSYCNTVPTPQGGSHEAGLRNALLRGLKALGELVGNKRAAQITGEDVMDGACLLLSLFIRDPQFQGQTKERLAMPDASRLVDSAVKDHFDHWLSADTAMARGLLERAIDRAEERKRRKAAKETARKSATRNLRLPGKLADCSVAAAAGTEIFLVEGDSAGGSAKQARDRKTQAILPLRGKILNVASASADKLRANQELRDLTQALGCGTGTSCDPEQLRYERVIIMTDADVDGAHIASLLMTYFYREMRPIIEKGHLYLAQPPLYRLACDGQVHYARDDAHKDALIAAHFARKRDKVEVSRFKGLGEMPPAQLKQTTMSPASRTLLQVHLPDPTDPEEVETKDATARQVDALMGRKPELRLAFIQQNARFARDLDV